MLAKLWVWHSLLDLGWLIFLLLVFCYLWRDKHHSLQAKHWIKTKGQIIHWEWTMYDHSIWPKIEYIYQVNELDHIGKALFLELSHHNPNSKYARSVAYRAALAYQNNQAVDIYYNPENPEQASLDISISNKLNLALLIVCGLIVLHLTLFIFKIMQG